MIKRIKNKKAFTLIEFIVTIAVLGVLVLLASPRFFGHTQNAELAKGFANAKSIEKASELYYMDHEDWPRLTDEPYSSEEIESYSERIFNHTGHEVNLDPEGNYYDIDYDKLSEYIQVPDDKKNYILQNPVGKVFYMENLNETGKSRVDYNQVIKNDEEQEDTFEFTATFTNAGSTGRTGPTQSQLDNAYAGTLLAGQVVSDRGIQLWTVPESGTYKVEAYGAQGGNSTLAQGGKGAIMTGELNLVQGEALKILIGQQGENSTNGGGGGGGTSVARFTTMLILAGGGGGGSSYGNTIKNGLNGNISEIVEGVASSSSGTGGDTGGGYKINGKVIYGKTAATSYLSGGLGGTGYNNLGSGGFGSGGGRGFSAGGGGGGYIGGYGGGNGSITAASGGTSINSGENQANSVGNTGHGKVIITYIGK